MELFVVNSKSHPEDVQPTVILPYVENDGTPAVREAVKLNLASQGLRPRMEKLVSDWDYDRLVRSLWSEGEPFIIVEHDIVPWPGALVQLWQCPQAWCGFPYYVFGEFRSYLGCTKFDPARLGTVPLTDEPEHWSNLDQAIGRELTKRDETEHVHLPAVSHLNFAHSRPSEAIRVHPHFWEAT